VAVLGFMAGEILAMFTIGLIIVYLIDPVVTMLARRGLPRALGTIFMMVVLTIGLFIVAEITFRAIVEQGAAFVAAIPGYIDALQAWYLGLNLPPTVNDIVNQMTDDLQSKFGAIDWGGILLGVVTGIFGVVGSFFSIMGLVFFIFYATADRPRLTSAITRAVPLPWRGDVLAAIRIALDLTGHYVRSEGVLMVIVGVMTWTGLMVLSVVVDPAFAEFALFLAFIAMLGELIPTFGPIIAFIPALLFSLSLGPEAVVATVILYILIMFIEGQILVPNIQGHAVEIHPALVIILILCGVAVAGIFGAIVVLPLAAIFRDVTVFAYRRAAGILPPPTIDLHGVVTIPELPPEPIEDLALSAPQVAG
jgi:predicted PurR-regulated permease PerM